MKFFEEINCEHGWLENGFGCCSLGSGCSDMGFLCFCNKEDCPLIDEDHEETNPDYKIKE